jgi:hypothetical protein
VFATQVALLGIEPKLRGPEPPVLPLHHKAVSRRERSRTPQHKASGLESDRCPSSISPVFMLVCTRTISIFSYYLNAEVRFELTQTCFKGKGPTISQLRNNTKEPILGVEPRLSHYKCDVLPLSPHRLRFI